MKYLSGVTSAAMEPSMVAAGIGLMVQPGNSYHLRISTFPYWAADNGCFANRWVEVEHFDWLDRLPRESCLFAVSPDVYGDAAESLRRGLEYAPLIREMGFPVAVVAQDGAERLTWPWDEIDCLFLGGTQNKPHPKREWKVSAAAQQLVTEARRYGIWVHMGRVNSMWRLARAREMGCNSADGTFLRFRRRQKGHGDVARRGAQEVGDWLRRLDYEPVLWAHESPSHPTHRRFS